MLSLEVKEEEYIFSGRSMQITKDKNALLEPHGKMMKNYGVVLSLLPEEKQKSHINQQIGNARFVHNDYLEQRKAVYEKDKTTLTPGKYKKDYLPKLKEDHDFLYESDKFALEAAIEHVDAAYKRFYDNIKKGKVSKQAGFPKKTNKDKPNGNSYTTKFTNNNIELLVIDGLPYIKLPKLGKIRFVLPKGKTIEDIKPNNTHITSAVVRKAGNDYTVSIQMETIVNKPTSLTEVSLKDCIASDMGIKDFAIYGNEDFAKKVENPRFIKIHEKRLRRLQKSLSRKRKGSKNYNKAKVQVAKEHRKIKNQRKDFHHKLSEEIVKKCDVFICEDLNIKGMVKNHKLAKEISSVGWGQFLNFVKYKIERKGGKFMQVGRFFPSSKTCDGCGYKNTELELKDREWTCPVCGVTHDRDINAKNTILHEGLRILTTEQNIKVIA